MTETRDPEALFLENLGWIERVVASLCRRHGLTGDDAEDAAAWIKLRLIEDGYAALRKFRGESAITTYLTVVVSMLFRDYRVSRWGRWRPSTEARRQGRMAVRLETLVYRDGYRLEQAAEILRTTEGLAISDRECAALLAGLPVRAPMRPVEVGPEPLDVVPAAAGADERVMASEVEIQRRATDEALERALAQLPAEDRVILRMRFWEDLSVAQIARGLGLEQKPLYRRLDRLLGRLRALLEREGVSHEWAREVLDGPGP